MTAFPEHTLLPLPRDLTFGDGHLRLDGDFRIAHGGTHDQRLVRASERFVEDVRELTDGRVSPVLGEPDDAVVLIDVEGSSEAPPETLEDESYALTVSADGVLLEAPKIYGALYGLQTLLQLIMPAPDGYWIPVARVVDRPRFGWRGLLLDAVRHWLPPHVIKRNLNAMAAVKLNVFHWHLTDDQGFRIESRQFPRLHELGSDGNYYTQEDVRGIVEHARDRGIRVVPEFDMPGHTTSWFVGHPELASAPGPYAISRHFGGHKATMDPTQDSTVQFAQDFLLEMMSLFPDRFIHLGGDEVDPEQWQSNAAIRRYMGQNGHEGPHDLLVGFHNRLHEFVREQGRESIGWNPLTDPKLESRVVVQSVRGQQWVAQAIGSGHRAIASSEYYLDAMLPASHHYLKDPLDGEVADTTDEQRSLVLGAEASMWTEFATADNIDSRTWPRAAAVAERLWSPREVRDVADLYRRLTAVSGAGNRPRSAIHYRRRDESVERTARRSPPLGAWIVTYSSPSPTDEPYGEIAALRYNKFEGRPTGFARLAAPRIAAFYARHSIANINPSVLDLGCGTGQLASYLLDQGIPVTGIDISEHMLRYAVRNNAPHVATGSARFLVMDCTALSLSGSFGLTVATFNTFNHLPSHEHLRCCLSRVYQATAPGGYFLFDIDTRLGLQRTAEIAELSETREEATCRIRRFDGERVILYATGWFIADQRRYRYREMIAKTVIDTEALRSTMTSVGWSSMSYTADDYCTPVANAEDGVRAYGVARRE